MLGKTACTKTCGGGIWKKRIGCMTETGQTVSPGKCEGLDSPQTEFSCNTQSCGNKRKKIKLRLRLFSGNLLKTLSPF